MGCKNIKIGGEIAEGYIWWWLSSDCVVEVKKELKSLLVCNMCFKR